MTFGSQNYIKQWIRYCAVSVLADIALFSLLFTQGVTWNTAHLFSFLTASLTIGILWTFWTSEEAPATTRQLIFRYVIMQLLVLFLRGGILAALVESANILPIKACLLSALASSLVTLLGAQIWLYPEDEENEKKSAAWSAAQTLSVVGFAILLRIVYSWTFELLYEEAYYWNYAQHLDIGYLDHPPMVSWLIWVFTSLFGHTEFVVRLGAFTCWLVAAYFVYKLTQVIDNDKAAFNSLVLTAVLPLFFGTGLVMTPDAPLIACWAGALYFLYRAVIEAHRWSWLGVGAWMGLGLLSKYTIALLGFSLVVFLLTDRDGRKWFLRPEPYLGLIITLALFSPVIFWNARHQWASFGFQSTRRLAGHFDFALPELLGASLLLLTPTGFLAVIAVVLSWKKNVARPLRLIRSHRLFVMTTLIPFAIFFFFSLFRLSKLNWTAPIWLGSLPYVAAFMTPTRSPKDVKPASLSEKLSRYAAMAWPATLVSFLLVYGIILHYTVLGFPGIPYPKTLVGIGIPNFVRHVAEIEKNFEQEHGQKPFIACMDSNRLASWIAFYRTKTAQREEHANIREFLENTTGGQLFEVNSYMYRFWHPTESYDKKRPIFIITARREYLLKDQLLAHVRPTSSIKEFTASKHGKPTTPFFYQFATMR